MTEPIPATVAAWHRIVDAHDPAGLPALLADDVVFRSPRTVLFSSSTPTSTARRSTAST